MGFEKRVLEVATECGIDDAYFYEGTMFFGDGNVTLGMIDDFCEAIKKSFTTRTQLSYVGDEIAVDFVAGS